MIYHNNSIFWVDVQKISPNPFQPRREFDEAKLRDLADSIRQYGILQPLVVSRKEEQTPDGGLFVSYELIAGERRLRASKLAGVSQVPVVIREGTEHDDLLKLELAIIENLQREDLNPVDRAKAFKQLIDKFGFKHTQIAQKMGKSREYVSNSIRLLTLPQEVMDAIVAGKITEGHARPLLMLIDRPAELIVLFKEIMLKKLTVREAERIARHTAHDKMRKRSADLNPELLALEERLTSGLGTRVQIESRAEGGKITIDFLSPAALRAILDRLESGGVIEEGEAGDPNNATSISAPIDDEGADIAAPIDALVPLLMAHNPPEPGSDPHMAADLAMEGEIRHAALAEHPLPAVIAVEAAATSEQPKKAEDDDLYSIKNFSL